MKPIKTVQSLPKPETLTSWLPIVLIAIVGVAAIIIAFLSRVTTFRSQLRYGELLGKLFA